jgi:FkbM family methyltransferase
MNTFISEILKSCYNYDNWSNKTFLECGAGPHGNETANFEKDNDCFYIEPVLRDFDILSSIKNKEKIFNMGLSDTCGEKDFIVTSHLGNSSINHSKEHIEELKSYNSTFSSTKIKTITYESFLNVINKNIDVLVLDVEGHEIQILNTFLNLKHEQLPKIIVIECGYDWKERLSVLKQIGYCLDFYYFNNAYLTLPDAVLTKNVDNILNIRKQWKTWTYHGKLIYDDTDLQTISS